MPKNEILNEPSQIEYHSQSQIMKISQSKISQKVGQVETLKEKAARVEEEQNQAMTSQ